jgi:phage-related tail protein
MTDEIKKQMISDMQDIADEIEEMYRELVQPEA